MIVAEGCRHWRHTHHNGTDRVQAGNGSGLVIGWTVDDDDVCAVVALDDDDSWAHDCMWIADTSALIAVTLH